MALVSKSRSRITMCLLCRDLGSGAFATVRYARHILKDKTRSQWPEYAIKVTARYVFSSNRKYRLSSCTRAEMSV